MLVMGMSDLPSSIACGACALQPGSGFPLSLAEASSKGRAEEAYPVLVLGTQVILASYLCPLKFHKDVKYIAALLHPPLPALTFVSVGGRAPAPNSGPFCKGQLHISWVLALPLVNITHASPLQV